MSVSEGGVFGSCKLGGHDTGIPVLLQILEHFSVPVLLVQYWKTSILLCTILDNTDNFTILEV